jgi:uncharacterized YccA/Bax inhibitor family protein
MLRSSNPVLSRQDAFTPAAPQYGQSPWGNQPSGYPQYPGQAPVQAPDERMTFDDVVTKTAITMALMVLVAAATWFAMPDALMFPALIVSGLVGFVVVLVVAFRRVINPALVLVYAAIEGVFIGVISKIFEMQYEGIVAQAVLATFVAAGLTLAAYKFFNIRVTAKFTKIVIISTIAFAAVMLLNFVFSLVTGGPGLRGGIVGPVTPLAVGISLIAIVLAVLNLVLDFDYIEKGVAMGAPAKESWRAAFGLTVTMVWLYIEMLRLLSYLRR